MMRRYFLLTVTLLVGCARPAPTPVAAMPPALAAPALLPACPEGYTAVSSHEATKGAEAGHGFAMVRYMVKGKQMHLFCTPSTNIADPRRNRPVSGSIPDSESTKAAKAGGNQ